MMKPRGGIDALGVGKLSASAKFIAYFFGCEKFAHAIVGIERDVPTEEAYGMSAPFRQGLTTRKLAWAVGRRHVASTALLRSWAAELTLTRRQHLKLVPR
jgi:hypothetical protein